MICHVIKRGNSFHEIEQVFVENGSMLFQLTFYMITF